MIDDWIDTTAKLIEMRYIQLRYLFKKNDIIHIEYELARAHFSGKLRVRTLYD